MLYGAFRGAGHPSRVTLLVEELDPDLMHNSYSYAYYMSPHPKPLHDRLSRFAWHMS